MPVYDTAECKKYSCRIYLLISPVQLLMESFTKDTVQLMFPPMQMRLCAKNYA